MKSWTIVLALIVTVILHGIFLSFGFGENTPFLPHTLEGWCEFIIRMIVTAFLLIILNNRKKLNSAN